MVAVRMVGALIRVAPLVLALVLTGCGVGFHLVVSSAPVESATGCNDEEVQALPQPLPPVHR